MRIAQRTLLLLLSLALFSACGTAPQEKGSDATSGQGPTPGQEIEHVDGPRFDGTYSTVMGERSLYLMRFFPKGNVVLSAGPVDMRESLTSMLTEDAAGEPEIGYYNVPVTRRNDSLFFEVEALRGSISYACLIGEDVLHVLKHSHINGRKAQLEYAFTPDP